MTPGVCKHSRGTGDAYCCANVNVRALVGGPDFGWVLRRPCHRLDVHGIVNETDITCGLYKEPTEEEIAADNKAFAEIEQGFTLLQPALAQIRREHSKRDWRGTIKCPSCGGTITMFHSGYNGHTRGKCSTNGCLSWLE